MWNSRTRRSLAVTSVLLTVAALAACAAPASDDADRKGDPAAAARFVTCLEDEGQTAKILEGGQVGLLMPDDILDQPLDDSQAATLSEGEGGGPVSMSMISSDEDGMWMASTEAEGYPEEGGQREAWAACEDEVPEFSQPEPDISGAEAVQFDAEAMIAASLEFASCARENGFADFADPDSDGMLELPAGITEDEARSLLEACTDPDDDEAMPPAVNPQSTEGLDFDWWSLIGEFYENAGMVGITVPAEGDE